MPPHSLFCKNCGVKGDLNFEVLSIAEATAKIKCKNCGKIRRTSGRYGMGSAIWLLKIQEKNKINQ
jgi:uncharacterized Zn finger protein